MSHPSRYAVLAGMDCAVPAKASAETVCAIQWLATVVSLTSTAPWAIFTAMEPASKSSISRNHG